jgi:hypothetical protein
VRWRFVDQPTFDNQIAYLHLDDAGSRVAIEKTVPRDWEAPRLHEGLLWTSAEGVLRR